METSRGTAVKVGIFFVVGLILLIGFSLRTKGAGLVSGGYALQAYFKNVHALEPGSMVTLAGIDIGRVRSVDFDTSSGLVRVRMSIRPETRLAADSMCAIRMKSLLGQYYVNIKYGKRRDAFLAPGGTIESIETASISDLIETVHGTGQEIKELTSTMNDRQSEVLSKITEMVDENRENIKTATESLAEAGPKIESVFESVNTIIASVEDGEGTLGKLLKDEGLYERLVKISERLDEISGEISEGEGTLGKLVYSDELYEKAKATLSSLNEASVEVKSSIGDNKEKINKIVSVVSEEISRLEHVIDDLSAITEKIRQGEGTLGKLVTDPTLYEDTQKAVNQVEETFKQQEEQAIFQTFVGVVLGSFF